MGWWFHGFVDTVVLLLKESFTEKLLLAGRIYSHGTDVFFGESND